jgi:predicted kinase
LRPADSAADRADADRLDAHDRADAHRWDADDHADDLRDRLDRLPPGHPSSQYETDGTPRHPSPRLREPGADDDGRPGDGRADSADRPGPLDDAEWDEHVADVVGLLSEADAAGLATDSRYTTDPDREQWTAERDRVQGDLVAGLYKGSSEVPCDRVAIIAGGLGGAGKSTVLGKHAGIDLSQYLTINPDEVKEEMGKQGLIPEVEGLSPMEASHLVHEESSAVAKQLARKAVSDGKNVIWDITMSKLDTTRQRIDDLRAAGYSVIGIFVDIPVDTSIRRADYRHRVGHEDYRAGVGLGGRYVPAEVIRGQADDEWGSKNRKTFEAVRHHFDEWSRYDNSVDGRAPVLAETGQLDQNREESA